MTMEEKARLSFYQELAPIGGRANVMLVMHIQTKKLYVKKVLAEYNRSVYEIIRKGKNMHFPEIVELIDDGCLYLIEEYVDGETLETYGSQNLAEAIQAMRDICEGVSFLHGQNPPVIHRDLKPSNIMRDKDGIWKIIDVNTARRYDKDAARDTEYLGTKGFAAPEQFGFKQTDVRTDIYALGILFNYMLTGTSPVEKLCDGAAGRIVQKCIMFEPDRRYQTVEELLADVMALEEAATSGGSCEKNATTVYGGFREDGAVTATGGSCEDNAATMSGGFREDGAVTATGGSYEDNAATLSGDFRKSRAEKSEFSGGKGRGNAVSQNSHGKKMHPFLPPGFRSLTLWKMLLGSIGYFLFIWICATLEVKNGDGLPATGFVLAANRVAAFLWIFLTILLGGNYLGIQKKLPLTKSRNVLVRFIGIVLYAVLILIVDITILVILCG